MNPPRASRHDANCLVHAGRAPRGGPLEHVLCLVRAPEAKQQDVQSLRHVLERVGVTGGARLDVGQRRLGIGEAAADRVGARQEEARAQPYAGVHGALREFGPQRRIAGQVGGGRRIKEQCGWHELTGIGDEPRGTERIIGRQRLAGLDRLGESQAQQPAAQHRHLGANHLAVHRVGDAHLGAVRRRTHHDQPALLGGRQSLVGRQPRHLIKSQRLGEGEQLQRLSRLLWEARHPPCDQGGE